MAHITNQITEYVVQSIDTDLSHVTSEITEITVSSLDNTIIYTTADSVTLTAGVALSGGRAIATDASGAAIYADNDIADTQFAIVGISTGAAVLGDSIEAQFCGAMTDGSWTWNPQLPIFVTNDGHLTQTAPTTGYRSIIGYAKTATTIIINLFEPIVLA